MAVGRRAEASPDKNPGVKNIQERFARLGVISQILRSPERRERYNVSDSVDFHGVDTDRHGQPVLSGLQLVVPRRAGAAY